MAGCLRSRGWGEIRGRGRGTTVAGRDPRLGAYAVVGATYMGGGGRGSCAAKPSTAPSPPAPRSGLLALGAHRATVCRAVRKTPGGWIAHLSCEARQAPMVFVIVAVVVEGGGEYAGRTAVGAAARCWDGAGCEMRGWGEGEGGGVDPARRAGVAGAGVWRRIWRGGLGPRMETIAATDGKAADCGGCAWRARGGQNKDYVHAYTKNI
jgi:hypothetical protein